ncbi:MAG: hypothetical protein ABI442_13525 [Gemmatimonadaceae bacterium]
MARVHRFLTGVAALAVALLPVRSAHAQADAGPHRFRIDATALTPSQFVYQTTLERDVGTVVLGTRTITVSSAQYNGANTWLLLETRTGDGIAAADSLFAGIGDLHPIHWASALGEARLAAEFRSDSAFGGTIAPAGRRSIVASVPSGTLVSGAMLETALRFLPLQGGWEDSTLTLSITLNGNFVFPTRLAVIGEDRIRVPAGTFDCWVVAAHADPARGLYWVTKQDPIVVRSSIDVPSLGRGTDGGGAQLISVLARIGR